MKEPSLLEAYDLACNDSAATEWVEGKCAEAVRSGAPFEWYRKYRDDGTLRSEAEARFGNGDLSMVVARAICNAVSKPPTAPGEPRHLGQAAR